MKSVLIALSLILTFAGHALAVDITIKLPEANATVTMVDGQKVIDWKPALKLAAQEIQAMNAALPELEGQPIPCNPEAEQVEGYLGNVNTPPNEYGYVTARIDGWRKLIIPPGVAPTTFAFVYGQPVEDVQIGMDEAGNPIYVQVYGGTIAE